jgi:hypothetical protein
MDSELTAIASVKALNQGVATGDSPQFVGITSTANVIVGGNLTVNGTTTTLNTATLDVEDKNITINYGAGDTTGSANGAGITIQDAVDASNDATILWDTTNDEFDFSHPINVAGKVTSTGTSVFASLDISGDIDVDGTTNLDTVDIDGPVNAAGAVTINGLLTANTGVVFNDGSADVDFRVESNGQSHMLFVDGGNNRVGIGGVVAPSDVLQVYSGAAGRSIFRHASGDGGVTITGTGSGSAASLIFGNNWDNDAGSNFVEEYRLFMDGADDSLKFKYNANQSTALTLSNAGAATFSSSVTAGAGQFSGVSGTTLIKAIGADSNGNADVEIFSTGTTGSSRLFFSDTAAQSGSIVYSHNSNLMTASSAGDLTLDAAGDIILDADGGDWRFKDAGAEIFKISNGSGFFAIKSQAADADIKFLGSDGGSEITALTLDMSAAGAATFNSTIAAGANSGVIKEIGSDLSLVQGAVGLRINDAASAISATTATANSDGAVDLGVSNIRFKRLYLTDGITDSGSAGSNTVFNDGGTTADFRVESDGNTLAFVVDAGNNTVSIGRQTTWSFSTNTASGFSVNANTGRLDVSADSVARITQINDSTGTFDRFYQAGNVIGSITTNGSSTAFNTTSDQRLKDNIADADDAGSKIDSIQVRKFDWKADGSHQDYGMVAQELQTVAPEAVSTPENPDEMMGVDYSKLVPMLVKEIQTLRSRITALENA